MSSIDHSTPEDDPALRDALKRCSPATYYAACKFRKHGREEDLRLLVEGLIERFVERDLRAKLARPDDSLRLREDLAIDSLTMMEVVMIAEEVLGISVSNEELAQLRTLGDVHAFIWRKMSGSSTNQNIRMPDENCGPWKIATAESGEVGPIEPHTSPITRLSG